MTTILSPYDGDGSEANPFRPLVADVAGVNAWRDVTGQLAANIFKVPNLMAVEADCTPAALSAIAADSRFIVLPGGPMTGTEVTQLQTKLAGVYYADVAKAATANTNDPGVVTNNLTAAMVRPPWAAGKAVAVGEVYWYAVDKNLYQVIQAHTTQADWTPPAAKALWKRFYEPADAPWPWVQPTGAHDSYPIGAKVTYAGSTWQNTINANVWQPGVTGWTNLTPPPPTSAWSGDGVAYKVNDQVTYGGKTYKCLQAHTSQPAWTPAAVPALWQLVG